MALSHRPTVLKGYSLQVCLAVVLAGLSVLRGFAQKPGDKEKRIYTTQDVHSHNDYEQKRPFYFAIEHELGSIEADVFLRNGRLYVAHTASAVRRERTLESLYLQPLAALYLKNKDKPYQSSKKSLQLLIDIKEAGPESVRELLKELAAYPKVFDPLDNPHAVRIIITGNRPAPDQFEQFIPQIDFDYALVEKLDKIQLERIGLVSINFREYCRWNGISEISPGEESKLKRLIDTAHYLNKKIRFYGAPDNPVAWKVFMRLGSDYLNTDHIAAISSFLKEHGQ